MVRVCPPQKHKHLFNLLELLCTKEIREVLLDCYSYEVEVNKDEVYYNENNIEKVNILDLKV